jgi:hypothetical protein
VVEAGEAGDDARGLDAPYGFDGAMQGFFQLHVNNVDIGRGGGD